MNLFQLLKKIVGAESPKGPKRYWLFYAGPENYLYENGVSALPTESFWSCEPETREGDLILVYRKSKNQLTVNSLMNSFSMSRDTAVKVTKMNVGKDFPVIWKATSNSKRQSSWHWQYGCGVREVRKISPPIQLEQLKAIPELKKWEGLRFNLRAKGRGALEIPAFAWEIINNVIVDGVVKGVVYSSKKAEP
jgi:predicted RNA-binding protein with PUA-like domain